MGAGNCPSCDRPTTVYKTRHVGRVTVRYRKCRNCKVADRKGRLGPRKFATTEKANAKRRATA